MKVVRTLSPFAAVALMAACGLSQAPKPSEESSISFQAVEGGDFSGNSVRICGVRGTFVTPVQADEKYHCFNNLSSALDIPPTGTRPPEGEIPSGTPGAMNCPCFTFGENGMLVSVFPVAGGPPGGASGILQPLDPTATIGGLCTSDDVPHAPWNFTYQVYTTGNCAGAVLNDSNNTNNFVCVDSNDVTNMTTATANQTTESLGFGNTTNHIVCSTVNARKTFEFTNCGLNCGTVLGSTVTANNDAPVLQDQATGRRDCTGDDVNVFLCGCTGSAATGCTCETGLMPPSGCEFADVVGGPTCCIVCDSPTGGKIDGTGAAGGQSAPGPGPAPIGGTQSTVSIEVGAFAEALDAVHQCTASCDDATLAPAGTLTGSAADGAVTCDGNGSGVVVALSCGFDGTPAIDGKGGTCERGGDGVVAADDGPELPPGCVWRQAANALPGGECIIVCSTDVSAP
ncbi:MAG: hypothetical protein FWD17_14450 [Polyangiaceae bacterium]|nr:hypothetical protein [Polyangiaceae bacterium]